MITGDRRSVLLLMYDLPNGETEQRREYTRFRKFLRDEGFLCLQKSAYVLLLHNSASTEGRLARVRAAAPREGTVNLIPLSLGNFKKMVTVCGDAFPMEFFSDDSILIE